MSCTTPNLWQVKTPLHHSELDDSEFMESFENGSLAPNIFSHEAHLRIGWLYIKNYGEQQAVKKACDGIKQFDELHGTGDKFHVTLTVASIKVLHHFMKKSKSSTLEI